MIRTGTRRIPKGLPPITPLASIGSSTIRLIAECSSAFTLVSLFLAALSLGARYRLLILLSRVVVLFFFLAVTEFVIRHLRERARHKVNLCQRLLSRIESRIIFLRGLPRCGRRRSRRRWFRVEVVIVWKFGARRRRALLLGVGLHNLPSSWELYLTERGRCVVDSAWWGFAVGARCWWHGGCRGLVFAMSLILTELAELYVWLTDLVDLTVGQILVVSRCD